MLFGKSTVDNFIILDMKDTSPRNNNSFKIIP